MAHFLALIIALILLGMAVMQTGYAVFFYRFLTADLETENEKNDDDGIVATAYRPAAAVVLCLRGSDPSLVDCLTGLSLQEYPNFKLHIVVDNEHDPALEIVNEFFDASKSQPEIHVISEIRPDCSLKCSAILEAISNIPSHIDVFAFIDADCAPDQNWLSDLIAPLVDPAVGATTGNRWFTPTETTLGSYVRQLWNAAAIVQMDVYDIAWGGTLAISRSTLEKCDLETRWGRSFCEDTLLSRVMKQEKIRLVRVPDLILENTESTSLQDSFRWIVRQLLTVRLYHPRWNLVKLHGLATIMGVLVAPVAIVVFYFLDRGVPFYTLSAAWLIYQFWNAALLWFIGRTNQRVIRSRESFNQQNYPPTHFPLMAVAFLLVQFVHPLTCFAADRTKRIRWRGIDYQISKHGAIKMLKYQPYHETLEKEEAGEEELVARSID